MTKRIICLFLLTVLIVGTFGCKGHTDKNENATFEITDTESTPDTEPDIYSELPSGDYGGEEFVFANETDSSSWAILMLDVEELTGEVLDNAVYMRNLAVEDKLGITIRVEEYVHADDVARAVTQNVMSGEDPYDVYDICANYAASLILEDMFVDVSTLGLDIEKPWWNDTVMDSLTFTDRCYSIAGDLSIMLWEASYGLAYNKDMAERLGLPDQYELVHEGKWTLDAMNEAMVSAYQSNGDTIVDDDDTFGMTGADRFMTYMLIAGGENIIHEDEKGLPLFEGLTERMADMYEKILGVYYTNDSVFIAHRMRFARSDKTWHTLFTDGNALYYFEPIGSNVKLRNVAFDYGFLPMPKYDESQEEYITPIVHYAHTMHVTTAHDDLEMVRVVLENLAAESRKSVRSVYFDQILDGKRSKDDGTIEMFDIIFENQVMNPATIYDWGTITSLINSSAYSKKSEIASRIASITPSVEADLRKTVYYYSK